MAPQNDTFRHKQFLPPCRKADCMKLDFRLWLNLCLLGLSFNLVVSGVLEASIPMTRLRPSITQRSPASDLNLQAITFVVFDLETTGLNPQDHQIIEIGAKKIRNGQIIASWTSLVSTGQPLSREITRITNITTAMLEGQPEISEVMQDFFNFIQGSVLVAHNASFDYRFLQATADRLGFEFHWPILCTLKMSRALLPDLPRKNLASVTAYFGLTNPNSHRALNDAQVTAQIFINFIQHYRLVVWGHVREFALSST